MALVKVNDYVPAGGEAAGQYHANHLPSLIFDKPAWDQMIYEQYPQYYLTSFIESYARIGEDTTNDTVNWTEDGKWYKKSIYTAVADISAGKIRMTLNEPDTNPYYIISDVITTGVAYPGLLGNDILGRIYATSSAGGFQTIDVELIDPQGTIAAYVAANFTPGDEMGLRYNSQTECFTAPGSRFHYPSNFSARVTKISHTLTMTDDASNKPQWFKVDDGTHYWAAQLEIRYAGLHKMAVDQAVLWGQEHTFVDGSATYTGAAGEGIVPTVARRSTTRTFGGTIIEDDIMEFITALARVSNSMEFDLFCGIGLMKDVATALKAYTMNGSVKYGTFGIKGTAMGVNVDSYRLNGRTVNFMEYKPFSDPQFTTTNTNGTNYDQMALAMTLGGNQRPEICYRKSRKAGRLRGHIDNRPGLTFAGPGQVAVQNQACDQTVFTTEVGVKMKGCNDHGMLVKV